MVISNVCTKEVSKFSQKIFVIDALLEEKPGAIKYSYYCHESLRISRIREQ